MITIKLESDLNKIIKKLIYVGFRLPYSAGDIWLGSSV